MGLLGLLQRLILTLLIVKDMGTMINRRRVCGGKKEDTYIKDGLVFWLDGINKGSDNTAWTDLINGISFPYNSGQEIRSDSVYFNGNAGLTSSSPSLNHLVEYCQIEIVIDNNSGVIITPNKVANIAFGFATSNNNVICVTSLPNYEPYPLSYRGVFQKQKTSYSTNRHNLIYDDVVLNPIMYNSWTIYNPDVYEIGHKAGSFKYTGNIYSIRIYNRHLTDEERIHNYNIDKKRFNL